MTAPLKPLAQVTLDMRSVMNRVHEQYQGMIAQMTQTNAELTVGLDALAAERDQLRARLAALTGSMVQPATTQADPVLPVEDGPVGA